MIWIISGKARMNIPEIYFTYDLGEKNGIFLWPSWILCIYTCLFCEKEMALLHIFEARTQVFIRVVF